MAFWFGQQKRSRRLSRRSRITPRRLVSEQLEQRLALSVSPLGTSLLVNDFTIRSQSATAITANDTNQVTVFDGNGPIDSSGVFAEVVSPDGSVAVATFRVNSTVQGVQHSAAVDGTSEGKFVVAWTGRGVGDMHGIFFQRFDADGTALGGETLVNTTIGGAQTAPAVAMAEDGSFFIAWSGVGDGDVSGVFLRRFDASGTALGDELLVNTETDDHQQAASLAFNAAGDLMVAWQSRHQDGEDWGVYAQRFSSTGDRLGSEIQLSTTTAGSQKAPALAMDPTGGFVAAWQSHGQDGDGWGVVARHFANDGTATAGEFMLNESTAGNQQDVAIAVAEDGQWLAAWSTGVLDGSGWEVAARSIEVDGSASATAIVNRDHDGLNSGHQQAPSVAIVGETAQIVWSGAGATDREGVYSQSYDLEFIDGPPVAPSIAAISDKIVEVLNPIEIRVTATDSNSLDILTFELDFTGSPAGATLEQIDNNTAIIRWTPGASDDGQTVGFRVRVTDDGETPLSDSEEFEVEVADQPLFLDLNGSAEAGNDATAGFIVADGAAIVADKGLLIIGVLDGVVTGATAILDATPDGDAESLAVDTTGTSITATYDSATRTLTLSGSDSVTNYQKVLRTLSYNNTASEPGGDRTIVVRVTDGEESASQSIVVSTVAPDLVAFAKAIADSGARFYGAAWCPACTAQKELFEDGSKSLPFIEVTNADRTPNQVATDNGITTYPTWIFQDGTRLEGSQTLQTLSDRTGIAIPTSDQPYLAELSDDTLLVGSPLHVSLDGYDPNGGPLTYTVSSDNADVTATILSGNRSARINVAGFGDMVFELFEGRAERATSRMIELAEDDANTGDDFYKDIIFHRVVNGFVIQGGDPTGTGSGGSTLGNFDDQFHPDLQHNRTGLLSMAKTSDDTNDSQFFITEGVSRHLDFNHTIFGVMVEGEANRQAISNTAVSNSQPVTPVVMEDIEIFDDIENGVLMLKAADGATGSANITVTVTDQNGNTFERVFKVDLADDTIGGTPYLGDVAPISVASNTVAEIQLTSVDVEGDDVFYTAQKTGTVDYTVSVSDTGLVSVTPPTDFVGTVEVIVGVGASENASSDLQLIEVEFV